MEREFDIIVYGASGLASKYIIAALAGQNINLAVAGRSSTRILQNISLEVPIFEVNINDIDTLTATTRILINCAGPYIFSGEKIVESCVRNSTHYIDISGETYFIERCIHLYSEKAREKGVFIINCCGFDSVPADIGVQYLKEVIKRTKKTDETIAIESIMVPKQSFINKTTYESAVYGFAHAKETSKLRKINRSRSNLTKNKVKKLFYDTNQKSYCAIFPGTDASVVKRSQTAFVKELGDKHCDYFAYVKVGNMFTTIVVSFFAVLFYMFALFDFGRFLLIYFSRVFTLNKIKGRRPTEREIERGSFDIFFNAKHEGKTYSLVVSGPDPGYITTAACVSECAVLLLEMLDEPRENMGVKIFKGGVLTPACVFYGTDLIERLEFHGITFELKNS